MKMQVYSWVAVASLLLTLASTWSGCVKRKFDEPPVDQYPVLTANHTIASIVGMHTIGGAATLITDTTTVITGIVTADDASGNFYKQIVIQDSTAGLQIRIDGTSLYNDFPIGRRVWIKCKGLYIGDYSGSPQLSFDATGGGIPQSIMKTYIIAGERNQTVTPLRVGINGITPAHVNMLVQFDSVEFGVGDTAKPYADGITKFSVNHNVEDCTGGVIILRSSGYANFVNDLTPTGRGSIVGVTTLFGTTKQLIIRDLYDVTMSGTRCGGSSGGTCTKPQIDISALRAMYAGSAVLAPNNKIHGIAISDLSHGNANAFTLIVQDGTAGIAVRLDVAHSIALGDEVEICLGTDSLKPFKGLLQVYAKVADINIISHGNSVVPRVATLSQIATNFDAWESTLVQVQAATISSGTYSGSRTLADATGSTTLYTAAAATFSGVTVPAGNVDVTGIISDFNGLQIQIRDTSDVDGGTPPPPPVLETIANVRALYTTGTVTVGSIKIQGIVISDVTTGNIVSNNIVVQEQGGAGVVVRFSSANTAINVGDEVEINITGGQLTQFQGLLQVQSVSNSAATVLSTGNSITPTVTTISNLIANFSTFESTLVTVQNASLPAGTYSGSKTLTDATGTIKLYTRTAATFAGTTMPTGNIAVTAIVTIGGTTPVQELSIRTTADVQ